MRRLWAAAISTSLLVTPATAKEGMFTPDQLPEIADDLRKAGLRLDPDKLKSLTAFPMGAIVSLGGCSASFVSPKGLVVTNHHCAFGSIQFNSTEQKNYLKTGFLAKNLTEELPAQPGSRIYVTVKVEDVTDEVFRGLGDKLSGRERFQRIDDREKALIARCEADPGHRCQLKSFSGGLQYKLIKRLEIRDVRLVYAPANSIGKYGGEIDNWQWPRHTGDFSFYRAYVAPDGSAADYANRNVPYAPKHHLKVSARGLADGDFAMVVGYPGSTSRYTRLVEVKNAFEWRYPTNIESFEGQVAAIEDAAPAGSDARIKYELRLAALNNGSKNLRGQITGARRAGLAAARTARESALNAWIAADRKRAPFAVAVAAVDTLAAESARIGRRDYWYDSATRPQLLDAARDLYRLSRERRKPDAARESGYQERDMTLLRQGLEAIERRYDPAVDKAEWLYFLKQYMTQPAEFRVAAFDSAMGLPQTFDKAAIAALLDRYYAATTLGDAKTRLALMSATPEALEASDDPFIKLAVALYPNDIAQEESAKDRTGRSIALRPRYMEALIAWQRAQGQTVYPDANSTLRVTYGNVRGGSPADGLIYEPFTRLEGIVAKDTGQAPFDAPPKLLARVRARDYGVYAMPAIGSVPVNFLSDLDITGGNSGSATLNAQGELVGLLFDSTLESVNSDWLYDPRTARAIHVDTRYMLWVMEKIDGAKRLIEEMEIVR